MKRNPFIRTGLPMLAALWVAGAAAAGTAVPAATGSTDAVYSRETSGGGVSLTNVPDGEGYEVLVAGKPSVNGSSGANAANGPPAAAPVAAVPTVDVATQAVPEVMAKRELTYQDPPGAIRRTEPAAPVLPDEPAVAHAKASAVAGQAFQDITAAGGASARLQALYQASQSAFQQQRPERR